MELLILHPHRIVDLDQLLTEYPTRDTIKSFICMTPDLEAKIITISKRGHHLFRPALTEVPDFATAVSIFSLMSSEELMRFLSGHATLPDYVPWIVMYILKVRGL
jgi:hypothetical protein